ncbi:MAG: hypothetical protein LBN30_08855 [Oscillospiraceae bacterium]|jgi:hypothetical protein|nr:hypothetical protein [Oscillospiraceae bacterium]
MVTKSETAKQNISKQNSEPVIEHIQLQVPAQDYRQTRQKIIENLYDIFVKYDGKPVVK